MIQATIRISALQAVEPTHGRPSNCGRLAGSSVKAFTCRSYVLSQPHAIGSVCHFSTHFKPCRFGCTATCCRATQSVDCSAAGINSQSAAMARRLIPLLDRVLIEKITAPTKSAGGVLLPESAMPKVNEGVVLAVGPGRRNRDGDLIPPGVKEGDKVLLPEYGGSLVKLDNKEVFLYRDEDILGVLTE